MSSPSTIHGIPTPAGGDDNDSVAAIAAVIAALEGGSIIRRLSQAQIDALTGPQKPAGVEVWNTTTNSLQVSNGSSFCEVSPLGVIMAYGGQQAPVGWTVCDGRAHGSAALQALIGSANTPDLRDRFVVGAKAADGGAPVGGSYNRGDSGGAASVTLTAAQSGLPAHTHGTSGGGQVVANGTGATNAFLTPAGSGYIMADISQAGPSGASASHENRPPYYALVYIIKTF